MRGRGEQTHVGMGDVRPVGDAAFAAPFDERAQIAFVIAHGVRRNAAFHREVGQDFCSYFDLATPQSLARMVRTLDHKPGAFREKNPSRYPLATWRDSCEEFLHACLDHGQAAARATPAKSVRRRPALKIAA